eukprot:1008876-Pelagomonas_calceolata.AAC.1
MHSCAVCVPSHLETYSAQRPSHAYSDFFKFSHASGLRRASKFGGEYIEPSRVKRELALEARKERFAREGFATGIDIFSQAHVQTSCIAAAALTSNMSMLAEQICDCPPEQ